MFIRWIRRTNVWCSSRESSLLLLTRTRKASFDDASSFATLPFMVRRREREETSYTLLTRSLTHSHHRLIDSPNHLTCDRQTIDGWMREGEGEEGVGDHHLSVLQMHDWSALDYVHMINGKNSRKSSSIHIQVNTYYDDRVRTVYFIADDRSKSMFSMYRYSFPNMLTNHVFSKQFSATISSTCRLLLNWLI